MELPDNRIEDEVASDDDKNNIEMIEDEAADAGFDSPQIRPINTSEAGESPATMGGGDETLVESFVLPGAADGFSLDFI